MEHHWRRPLRDVSSTCRTRSGGPRSTFSPTRAAEIPGARRVVDSAVEEVVELTRRPLPRRHLGERSRSNPPTAGAGMVAGPR